MVNPIYQNGPAAAVGVITSQAQAQHLAVVQIGPGPTGTSQPQAQQLASQQIGPGPTGLTCISCNKKIVTHVEYSSTCHTHIVSLALCAIFGCCCGCCIPYCMKSCKVVKHFCPECKAFLGTFVPT